MKKSIFFVCIFFFYSGMIFPQKRIVLDKIYTTDPVSVKMPVTIDNEDLDKNKFDYKDLLGTSMNLPGNDQYKHEVRAEVMREYFFIPKANENPRFHFFTFNITSDRYAKATLKITSPGMLEVFIDGKKEIIKSSVEDSLQVAKVMEREFGGVPGTTSFVVKYMTIPDKKSQEGFKIHIEPADDDSLTNFKISHGMRRSICIQDIIEGTRLTGTKISPNGKFLISNYRDVSDEGKANNYSELYDTKTDRRIFLGASKVAWMPVSNKFYYTVKKGNNIQLVGVDPETFEEKIISPNIPSGNFMFSPDEKFLLFSEKESFDDRKGDLKLLASPEDRQQGYYDRYFIYKFDLSSGVHQRLTFGRQTTSINDISSDSRYLLFSTNDITITERPFRKSSLYKLDLSVMKVDTIWKDEPFVYSAVFSPDGSKILFTGTPEAFNGTGMSIDRGIIPNGYNIEAYIMDLDTKKIDTITKDFDPSISSFEWSSYDKNIYFKVVEKDYERLYRYDTQKKQFSVIPVSEDVMKDFSVSGNSPYISYYGTSVSNSTRSYLLDLKNNKSILVSDPYKETLMELNLGEVHDWTFTSSDGTEIDGRYYLPPGFEANRKYPMIVYYYGGTTPVPRTFDYRYPMHVYATLGYVVYVIQPSGTIGYGQEFSSRHVNAWGKRTAEDIIEGTNRFITEHSFIDKTKVGCIGASYGGFMTMYLQTITDIFAAAISHAGISSLSSYWGEGYWGYSYNSVASAGSYPWNNKELYVEQSPLFNADKIKTPLLLLHGMDDTNVPVGESIQLYTALKILGSPVEFIQVKNENHSIMDYKRRIEWNYAIYAWFAKWLKDDPAWWDSLYPEKK